MTKKPFVHPLRDSLTPADLRLRPLLGAFHTSGAVISGLFSHPHICRSVCVPDTGEAVLPNELFDEIPDTALCELYLFRGDVENIDSESLFYKVMTEVHDMMNFVLIRNIE